MKPLIRLRRGAGRALLAVAALAAMGGIGSALGQSAPAPTLLGWEMFRNDRALPAAEAWSQAATQAALRRNASGLRDAAFASILAAIAYEKAGDERAYARWADAVRLYLEAGLTWERERDELRNRWRKLERDLSQASAGVPPTLGGDDQMLADLVRRANLLEYKGPRTGLRDRRDEAAEISNITPQYFAGSSQTDSSNDLAAPQSRYGSIADAAPAGPGGVLIGGRSAGGAPRNPNAAATNPAAAAEAPASAAAPTAAPPIAIAASQPRGMAPSPSPSPSPSTSTSPDSSTAASVEPAPATSPIAIARPVRDAIAAAPVALQGSAIAQGASGLPRLFMNGAGKPRTLTAAERATAQQAWRYVMANRQSATGLVNGKDSYPVSSVADIAQTIAAYTSALALQFIEKEGYETDMRQLLATLRELPLYNRELYNRDYDSRSGRMLDLGARSSEQGSGWAAEDIGRLLLWLRILGNTAPDLAPSTEAVVARLRMSRLVAGGLLHSALNQDGREQVFNDLRLGRQQATAAALSVWGVVLPAMLGYDEAELRRVGSVTAPADKREGGTVSPEVFARGIVELGGIDGCFESAARSMLDAQHALAARKGSPVMVADELLDRAPWFVYGALATGGEEWRVVGFDQQPQPALANFSLKAAHLWSAVDTAAPTLAARGLADTLERSERGLYGGRYLSGQLNLALTLETNASVLLAAHHVQRGGRPMLRVDNPVDHDCAGLRGAPK